VAFAIEERKLSWWTSIWICWWK